jgi:hypothetical protein
MPSDIEGKGQLRQVGIELGRYRTSVEDGYFHELPINSHYFGGTAVLDPFDDAQPIPGWHIPDAVLISIQKKFSVELISR